ncbi:MAG: mechanosensitive ion channel [Clostridia bacterium]|nr:mechanosensitive ion channel [Clostridia bacterium]
MWKDFLNSVATWATTAGLRIVIALVIIFISFKVINKFGRKIEKSGDKGKLDKTLAKVFAYIFKIGLKCIVVISLIGYVGIDTSGITALIASLGLCVGLAVNGALSNLAGGILIIITRPFKIDDYIEAQGYSGTVVDIHLTNTRICTPDNKIVYVPNGALSTGTIVNYSEKDIRRVDLTFNVSYNTDVEKAKALVTRVIEAHELTLKDPAPFVRVSENGESKVTITARVWTNNADYWTVYFDVLENVKSVFEAAEIEVPYNRLNVHIDNE